MDSKKNKKKCDLISRRGLLKSMAVAGAGLVAAPMLNFGRFRLFANSPTEYSARAIGLVKESTVIDMLCVMTLDFAKQDKWFKDPETFTAADLQPWKDSGINVIHPALGMGGMTSLSFLHFGMVSSPATTNILCGSTARMILPA